MNRKTISLMLLLFVAKLLSSQSLSLALEYMNHNLTQNALVEFILVLNSKQSNGNEKAEALYYLGQISFEQQKYSVAMKDWMRLISEFPETNRAKEINDRLVQLRDVFSKLTDENVNSVVAQSYLNNGNFWSESDEKFSIDTSWLPNVELANHWYDKVITEFPNTSAAEIAFKHKLFALFGWEEPGKYGSKYGLKESFSDYLPIILRVFSEFEKKFPTSSYLQAFRYQIAQAYWKQKDWKNTRDWLNMIIENSEGKEAFYTELAKYRLKKLEY